MTKVLLLSKNPIIESRLQNILQRVNAEVYCSSSLFYEASEHLQVIQYFTLIMVCDTISNVELGKNIKSLKDSGLPILRRGNQSQIEDTEFAWLGEYIDSWLEFDDSDSVIIDKIARAQVYAESTQSVRVEPFSRNNFSNFLNRLSKKEKQLLCFLYEANGKSVSREDLCQKMWHSESNHAGLSNLSAIAKRLKVKMNDSGLSEDCVGSSWGQGYYLHTPFLLFLRDNDFDKYCSGDRVYLESQQ